MNGKDRDHARRARKIAKRIGISFGFVLLVLAPFLFAGCLGEQETLPGGRILVAVTVPPQREMVEAIGSDHVEVVVAVPPGADPHSFEPTPGAVAKLSGASLYCTLGNGLLPMEDTLVTRLSGINPKMIVADTSTGITLLQDAEAEDGGGYDPHIWLSPENARVMARNVAVALATLDPANASAYTSNGDAYDQKLDALDRECGDLLANATGKSFIAVHPAWTYFADRYGLVQIAVEESGKEPTIRDIEGIIQAARENGIRTVVVEPQYSSRGAELIASEINGTVIVVDPLPSGYSAGMKSIAVSFAGALAG